MKEEIELLKDKINLIGLKANFILWDSGEHELTLFRNERSIACFVGTYQQVIDCTNEYIKSL